MIRLLFQSLRVLRWGAAPTTPSGTGIYFPPRYFAPRYFPYHGLTVTGQVGTATATFGQLGTAFTSVEKIDSAAATVEKLGGAS